ncbi:hypothetical protein ACFS4T_31995 [Pseudomonas lini]
MTYPEAGFYASIDRFFDQKPAGHGLYDVQRMANTLSTEAPTDFGGATLQVLWKTAESRENSGFAEESGEEKGQLSII